MNNSLQVLKKDLTPEYLAQLYDAMGPDHQIVIRNLDGKMAVYLQKKGKSKKPEQIRLNQFLLTKPRTEGYSVKAWVSNMDEVPPDAKFRRSIHRKEVNEKARKSDLATKVFLAALAVDIASHDISEAFLTSTPRDGNLYLFRLGDIYIYTKSDKTIVKWSIGVKGEFKYAPVEQQKLGTQKMKKEEVNV